MSALNLFFKRALSTSSATLSRKTVVYSNGVVVSWHPTEAVPFEQTKAINLEKSEEKSVLAKGLTAPRNLPKGPSNDDLKEIFYTDKNEWLTRNREDRLRATAGPRTKRQ